MNRCPSDRALWALSEGNGTPAERAHLVHCVPCVRRARVLADDLAAIGRVLRGPAPARTVAPRFVAVEFGWGAAAVVVLALGVMLFARPRGSEPPSQASADGVALLTAVSTSLFAEDAQSSGANATDLDVMVAAFDAAAPCEWQPGGCQDD
jgi:hypothetical protein